MPAQPSFRSGDKTRQRSTINDVAKQAGVSKATVSRFVNGGGAQLAPETAARVASVIAQLDYQPSPMAQSLKHGRTRLIGLAVADITNPFSVAVLQGAERACQESGYLIVLFNLGNEADRERSVLHALQTSQLDGLILNRVNTSARLWQEALDAGKPLVLVDRQQEGLDADFVSVDNRAVVGLALDHLYQQGWRDFMLVTEPTAGVSSRSERKDAFHAWVAARTAAADDCQGVHLEIPKDNPASCRAVMQHWHTKARSSGRAPAILSGNAVATLLTMGLLRDLQWSLGEDVGFVGIDETEWAGLIGPGLTTVAQPTDLLGQQAVRCLLERLNNDDQPARRIQLPGSLIERGSSARFTGFVS